MNKVIKPSPAPARTRILDAAEMSFADAGFAGASMKTIAARAGVAQGLLHYHFENKEGLYAAVIGRRAGGINAERLALLDTVDTDAPDAVSRIMEAFLRPPLGSAGGGKAYARIFAGLLAGTRREAALVSLNYDPTARSFIAALSAARPQAAPRTISWAYQMAIGALASALSRSDRADRLVGEDRAPSDNEEIIARLVAFAAGGLEAAIAAETATPD